MALVKSRFTNQDINSLIDSFKRLVGDDFDGLTATDAKIAVARWLFDIGEFDEGDRFQEAITKYVLEQIDE